MATQSNSAVSSESGDTSIVFKIKLFEQNGHCCVRMVTFPNFRPKQSMLILCEGTPSLENKIESIYWGPNGTVSPVGNDVWDIKNRVWGSNYSAALIAKDSANGSTDGEYQIVVATPVTQEN